MKFKRKIIPDSNYSPSFITKKRLYEDEIDFDQLRLYRLDRIKKELSKKDIGACILFDPVNIRYALDSVNMNIFTMHNLHRYCFIPVNGPIILFEFFNCEHLSKHLKLVDEIRPGISWDYFSQGYRLNLDDIINNAVFNENCSEMVVVRDIEFFSMCEHHMIPFFGKAHVGYIPNGKVIGLSKIPRIIDMFSRRLQVQERLTHQVADTIKDSLDPIGVAVVMEGRHLCMQMRGVAKQNSFATTSAMLGQFRKSRETRAEFLSFIGK